jgi:acyl carrier protein
MKDTYTTVVKIICDNLDVDESEINMDTSLKNDLDADSLDLVELIMAFEEEFSVQIEDDDIEKIDTVKDVVEQFETINK